MNQDISLDFYYNFFQARKELRKEIVLVSTKGGTNQMQTALRIQSISADIPKLIFLEPDGSAHQILTGKTPLSKKKPYWRFMQNQKYSTAIMLLEKRWDFDGAKLILNNWQETLNFLEQHTDEPKLQQDSDKLKQVVSKLDTAIACLNFDRNLTYENYDPLLNLYTQCRIYWELDQVASFLSRLGSFYEEVLCKLIEGLDGEKYCSNNNEDKKWMIIYRKFRNDNNLLSKFQEFQQKYDSGVSNRNIYRYTLNNRYKKRNFVAALVEIKHSEQQDKWIQILASLEKLDYWANKRNELIHGVRGMSKNTMNNIYKSSQQLVCSPSSIQGEMTNIASNVFDLLGSKPDSCIGYDDDRDYYLYSQIRQEAIELLNE